MEDVLVVSRDRLGQDIIGHGRGADYLPSGR